MKKILFLTYAALALFALSCTKEEDLPTPSPTEGKTFVSVGGSRELPATGTKSQMADDGVFSWTYSSNENEYNDEILICGYDSTKDKYTFTGIECIGYPDENEKKNARFEGWVTGSIQDYAVFPATLGASLSGSTLTLTLPSEIDWKKGEADNLMVAPTRTYANGVHNFAFYNVAGLFKVTLNGLPSTARKVSFYAAKSFAETSPKKITGAFSIDMSAVDLSGETKVYPQIVTTTATSDDCLTIKWTDEPEESMVFYVPVPTGEYTGFSFRVKDAEDNVLASFKGKTAKSVTRGKLIILPALTLTTAGGGGDNGGSKLVVPHNYTANNGVFVLPETSSDIELDIESNNEVTIAYSSENAEKKPANVYMTVLGDVNSLTINLPESHVELGGQTVNNNNYTITNLKANTSISTLLVKKTVKIGKSDVENSGLTVTGGSLDLAASVAGTVKVIYDPAEETVNKTNEKVSIKINSEIKDLVVTSASTQSAPDKIYVTIEEDAVVNSAITVPEVNCNLYIAPKAQATTVTTSAAENTVEGSVETIVASGSSTVVTVTAEANVETQIKANNGATVFVDNNATTNNPSTVEEDSASAIITGDFSEKVAVVGNIGYPTLTEAVTAAGENGTVTIIKAGTYEIPAIEKTLTIAASVDGVVVNHTSNSTAIATIASGKKAIFKNITFNLGHSFYHGFGTQSSTTYAELEMDGCTINGALSLYGVSTLKNCTFNATDADAGNYNIWAILNNATFTGCSFSNTNRAVNVYDFKHTSGVKNVSFTKCSFIGTEKKKAAINIHHNPDGTASKYAVTISNCAVNGIWAGTVEETGEPSAKTVCYSPVWMVSDINGNVASDITVTVNDVQQSFNPVAKIGTVYYAALQDAIDAASAGATVDLLCDVTFTTTTSVDGKNYNVFINKALTLNGNGHVLTPSNGARTLCLGATDAIVTVKDLTIKANSNPVFVRDNNMTVNFDNTVIDGTDSKEEYKQVVTIGSNWEGITLNVTNGSVIKTNDEGTDHYAIIAWSPVTINVDNSTLKGYGVVYVKPSAAGTVTNISNSDVESHGFSGFSNAFGMFVTEGNNNTFTLTSNNYKIIAGDQYQVLTELKGTTGNVIKLLGNSTFTPNDAEHGTLTSSWDKYYANSLYMDDANKETFANYISSECSVVKEATGTYAGLWKVTGPTPEVYYYWYSNNVIDGEYCKLADPFAQGWLSDNEYIRLERNVTLTANITATLSEVLHADNYFTMTFGDYNITKGEYSIILPAGLSVKTDKQTNVFTAAAGAEITETVENDVYTYTAVAKNYVAQIVSTKYETLVEAIAAVPDGTKTTIQMIADETMAENTVISISATKNIVLDLNSKTISSVGGSPSVAYYFIQNRGTLEITDLSSGKTGKITSACTNPSPGISKEYVTVYNIGGNLTLKAGTVETTSGGLSYAINNSSNAWGLGDDKETVFTMTGGTINAPAGDAALRVYQNCAQSATPYSHNIVNISGGTIAAGGIFLDNYIYNPNVNTTGEGINTNVTISGGEIHGLIDLKLRHAYNTTLNITGGTFEGSKLWVRKHGEWNSVTPEPTLPIVFISGGNFSFVNGKAFGLAYDCGASSWTSYTNPYSITGGTFNVDPAGNVALGYAATQSGNVYIVGPAPVADYVFEDDVVTVYTAAGLSYVSLHYADFRDSEHNLSIKLEADLNMTGKEFSSFDVNNYTSSDKEIKLFTFDGQNHTLSGMTGMLISKSWAGHSAMDVKNLTIANSTIEQDVDDINDNVGVGAICGNAEASRYLRITNVHLSNSTVRGGHWTGGLVGIAGGYDKANDGPVLEKIYVTNCSVEGCTIEGKGSNGALVGHAAMNPATLWEVKNFSVLNNSINNTGGKTDRTGALIGTLGDINRVSSAFPEEKNLIWFTSPLVVTGNSVLGVANNDAKKVGRLGTEGSPVYLDNVNVIDNWL